MSLHARVKALGKDLPPYGTMSLKAKTICRQMGIVLEKTAYLGEKLGKLSEFSKPLTDITNEYQFSKLSGQTPSDEEIASSNELGQEVKSKTGQNFTIQFCKSDGTLIANAQFNFENDSIEPYHLDLSYCVSLSGFTHESNMYEI